MRNTESNRKLVTRWWSGWQTDKIESWIEKMEAEGWHLVRMSRNATRFEFVKGEPRRIRYGVDYQTTQDDGYRGLFEDAGWELTYEGAGWYVWRKAYGADEARPEIYSDNQSRIDRNNRMMGMLFLVSFLQLPIILINIPQFRSTAFVWLWIVYLLLFVFIGYGILRLASANSKLRKRM